MFHYFSRIYRLQRSLQRRCFPVLQRAQTTQRKARRIASRVGRTRLLRQTVGHHHCRVLAIAKHCAWRSRFMATRSQASFPRINAIAADDSLRRPGDARELRLDSCRFGQRGRRRERCESRSEAKGTTKPAKALARERRGACREAAQEECVCEHLVRRRSATSSRAASCSSQPNRA